MPLLERLTEGYETRFGLDPEIARLSAQRLVGYFVLTVLYPGPLGVRPEDFDAQIQLEVEIARCLAEGKGGG